MIGVRGSGKTDTATTERISLGGKPLLGIFILHDMIIFQICLLSQPRINLDYKIPKPSQLGMLEAEHYCGQKNRNRQLLGFAPPDFVIPEGFLTGHAQWATRTRRVLIGVELTGRACGGSRDDPLPDRLLGCFLPGQVVRDSEMIF